MYYIERYFYFCSKKQGTTFGQIRVTAIVLQLTTVHKKYLKITLGIVNESFAKFLDDGDIVRSLGKFFFHSFLFDESKRFYNMSEDNHVCLISNAPEWL